MFNFFLPKILGPKCYDSNQLLDQSTSLDASFFFFFFFEKVFNLYLPFLIITLYHYIKISIAFYNYTYCKLVYTVQLPFEN